MRLEHYLSARKCSYAAAARGIFLRLPKDRTEQLSVTGETVRRWCLPEDHPDRRIPHDTDLVRALAAWSEGAVTSNDFHGISAARCERCAGAGGNRAAGANGHAPKRRSRSLAVSIAAAKKAARSKATMHRGRA